MRPFFLAAFCMLSRTLFRSFGLLFSMNETEQQQKWMEKRQERKEWQESFQFLLVLLGRARHENSKRGRKVETKLDVLRTRYPSLDIYILTHTLFSFRARLSFSPYWIYISIWLDANDDGLLLLARCNKTSLALTWMWRNESVRLEYLPEKMLKLSAAHNWLYRRWDNDILHSIFYHTMTQHSLSSSPYRLSS